ncbi:MAG: S1 RNA-binding domain-containing protein [Candidatus Melainabacteria bacterium]|nr:S1 RNA-binding domain-containing protein [Candidatus Melainabacteria bacterium]
MTWKGYSPYDLDGGSGTEEQALFARLLEEKYNYSFNRGDLVKGKVIAKESVGALVDIGAKTAAVLPYKEMLNRAATPDDEVTIGREYEFFILKEENEDGQLTLSRRRVAQAHNWLQLEEMMNKETIIECKVSALVKGGLLVDVLGLRGFVPSSHVRNRQPLEEMVGQTLPFKILTLDQQRNNIILSHRKVVSEQLAEQRRDLFSQIVEGAVIEGEVVRLTDFGAFVDLGGVDGLLPLSQMSWRWVEHPSDILKIGDKVKVEVIGVDAERQRVSLSIKSQQNDPWHEVASQFRQGDEANGTVTRIKHFGAFVEIFPGVEALLPMKDITEYEAENNTKIKPSDTIHTYIIKFHPEERRISLSLFPPREREPRGDYRGGERGERDYRDRGPVHYGPQPPTTPPVAAHHDGLE